MVQDRKELGMAQAFLAQLETQRLPKAMALQEKVGRGDTLNEWELAYLHEVLDASEQLKPLVDLHPEYQELYCRMLELYREIIAQALENEEGAQTG